MTAVAYLPTAAALGDSLGEADRVVVLGAREHAFAAAAAVGMCGRVTALGLAGPERDDAERERRRRGLYQVSFREGDPGRLPAGDGTLDAVVAARPAALDRPRGRFLGEVARVLRAEGRLVVILTPVEA